MLIRIPMFVILSLLLHQDVCAKGWGIALNAGVDIHFIMTDKNKEYHPRPGYEFLKGLTVTRDLGAWQIGLKALSREWKNKASVSTSIFGPALAMEETMMLVTGKPANTVLLTGSRKWRAKDAGYFVAGVAVGMTYTRASGNMRFATASRTDPNTGSTSFMMYTPEVNFYDSRGFTYGIHIGFLGNLYKGLGYSVEIQPLYCDMKRTGDMDPLNPPVFKDYHYSMWSEVLTVGLRYSF
jgi:hypothetical protein